MKNALFGCAKNKVDLFILSTLVRSFGGFEFLVITMSKRRLEGGVEPLNKRKHWDVCFTDILPLDTLNLILYFLPSFGDLLNLRLVNKRLAHVAFDLRSFRIFLLGRKENQDSRQEFVNPKWIKQFESAVKDAINKEDNTNNIKHLIQKLVYCCRNYYKFVRFCFSAFAGQYSPHLGGDLLCGDEDFVTLLEGKGEIIHLPLASIQPDYAISISHRILLIMYNAFSKLCSMGLENDNIDTTAAGVLCSGIVSHWNQRELCAEIKGSLDDCLDRVLGEEYFSKLYTFQNLRLGTLLKDISAFKRGNYLLALLESNLLDVVKGSLMGAKRSLDDNVRLVDSIISSFSSKVFFVYSIYNVHSMIAASLTCAKYPIIITHPLQSSRDTLENNIRHHARMYFIPYFFSYL